jgi:hypothetical protein
MQMCPSLLNGGIAPFSFNPDPMSPAGQTIDHIMYYSPSGLTVKEAFISNHPAAQPLQHKLCVSAFQFPTPPQQHNRKKLVRWITSRRIDYEKGSLEEEEALHYALRDTLPSSLKALINSRLEEMDSTTIINALADLQQHSINTIVALLPPDEARKKLRLASRCKGRSSFKDGFSPELIILKDYLLVIQTLMLTKPYLRHLKSKLYVKKLLSNSMVRFPTSNIWTLLGHFHPHTLTTLHSFSMPNTVLRRFAEEIKSRLHGRDRQRYRRQMNARIRAMQDQLELKEVSKVIRKLTDKPFQRVDLSFFRDNSGNFLESPRKIHAALVDHFSAWHSSPALMDKTAELLHFDPLYVDSLMASTPLNVYIRTLKFRQICNPA